MGSVTARVRFWLFAGLSAAVVPCAAALTLQAGGCANISSSRQHLDGQDRSGSLGEGPGAVPTDVRGKVEIRWNRWGVPFVEAERDDDVPYAMGLVHAQLRLGQLELLRMAAKGRLSEMGGPIAIDFDVLIRQIGFGAASEETLALMATQRPDTRAWLERYVRGINDYKRTMEGRPLEMRLLAIPDEEWTAADVLTVGRVACIDINWAAFVTYLRNRDEPGFLELWQRLVAHGQGSMPSFGPQVPLPLSLMGEVSKSGSNSWVVSGARRASARGGANQPSAGQAGAALIASDPHVGFNVPGLWIVAGYRSPGFEVLGLQIPGVPAVLLGRNQRIAWGGTNMVGLSSAAFDVSSLPPEAFTTRTEKIKVRLWPTVERTWRETPFGGVITDGSVLSSGGGAKATGPVAMMWRGRRPSDEISAFLDANRAQDWAQFKSAWASYAVSAQNMLYADVEGNIGQLLAMEFDPAAGRTASLPLGDPKNPAHRWGTALKSTDLPSTLNPGSGYLVSANNPPVRTDPPVTLLTSANDRVWRIGEMIEGDTEQSVASHARHQLDVYSRASHRLAQVVAAQAAGLELRQGSQAGRAAEVIGAWDGRYSVDSQGAAMVHRLMYHLAQEYYAKRYGRKSRDFLLGSVALAAFMAEDLESGAATGELGRALRLAASDTPEGTTWGDVHRLRVTHWLGNIPVLGGMYRYDEMGVPGNLTTVFKTATNVGPGVQQSRFGASARHVSDLADPDENYFVLMGGQDGSTASANFIDQVPMWQAGEMIRVPMRAESVAREFPTVVTLLPGQVARTLRAGGVSGGGGGGGGGGGEREKSPVP